MRPIDADDFVKDLHELIDDSIREGNMTMNTMLSLMYVMLMKRPTVIPNKIIHCQECDLWNRWDSAGRESLGNLTCSCAHWTVEDGAVIRTKPTDFCSYGERMVSEDV